MNSFKSFIFFLSLLLLSFPPGYSQAKSDGQTPIASSVPYNQKVKPGKSVGNLMMDFSLEDQDGKTLKFSEVRGDKPSFVYFYSGCCGHCSGQLPQVSILAKKLQQKGIEIIGVQYFGNSETCQTKIDKYELIGTNLADSDGGVCRQFGVGDLTIFTTDKQGIIRFRGNMKNTKKIENTF